MTEIPHMTRRNHIASLECGEVLRIINILDSEYSGI